ncbi:glycosyltransferase [Pontiellaceae bacterium B1224]|nr:glycosyltransferase [Pontiellaceae bacterium B1224]
MNILFVTFGELSINGGSIRPVSILRALADAGHQIFAIAARTDLPEHPHLTVLEGRTSGKLSRWHLWKAVIKATGSLHFDAIHAVDDAVLFSAGICRFRKIRLIYSAVRCFTGPVGQQPSIHWKWFPKHYQKVEKKILKQALCVLAPCATLCADIKNLSPAARILQIEDVPVQTLFGCREVERGELLGRFKAETSSIVVCSILPSTQEELRKVLMATRKVIDAIPAVSFFLKGSLVKEAEAMAINLDIQNHCIFLSNEETETFLSALDIADAAVLVPTHGNRYVHPEIFTLLHAPAPVVAVLEGAYSDLLNDQNSIEVLFSAESIAEGIIRVIQEPLFSIGLGAEGQQLIADRFSLSSFKHKIRMAYHEMITK